MIKVNKEVIKSMNPCKSRFDDNYLVHYPNFDGTLDEFLDLDKITYNDKVWVARRLLNQKQLIYFSILSSESVLNIYEAKYPIDKRVNDCLSFMKTIVDFRNLSNDQMNKLFELRDGAYDARDIARSIAPKADPLVKTEVHIDTVEAAYAIIDVVTTIADACVFATFKSFAAEAAQAAAQATYVRENQIKLNLEFFKMAANLD